LAFDPSRLYQQLLNVGLQNRDNPHYQFLREVIDALVALTKASGVPGSIGSGSGLASPTYITFANELVLLPNSKQATAGDNVQLDGITIPSQLKISSSDWDVLTDGDLEAGKESKWDVLTDGDLINPEFIFAGGEVIMLETRVPAPGIIYAGGEVIMVPTP
jgi:hypothetical protein